MMRVAAGFSSGLQAEKISSSLMVEKWLQNEIGLTTA
jgi:hypothetical protein